MDGVVLASTIVIAIAGVISAGSAVTSVILTRRLSEDNRALRKAGTEPEVVAYAAQLGRHRAFFHLVLENVGQGPACDVEIFVDAKPNDFEGFDVQDVVPGMRRKVRSLLPKGERVEVMMGVHYRLFRNDGKDVLPPFDVEVTYANLRGVALPPRRHRIDVSEFSGRFIVNEPEVETADALKKIEKNLEHFASGFKRLHVEMITTAEREAQEDEILARREQEGRNHQSSHEKSTMNVDYKGGPPGTENSSP